jgi:hypothetical protein
MARLAVSPKTLPARYPSLPITANALDFTWVAAGASFADGAGFTLQEGDILLAYNPDISAHTITITSVADALNRTGDITSYSLGAGEYCVFPQFKKEGWAQTTGLLHFATDNALVQFAVLRPVA